MAVRLRVNADVRGQAQVDQLTRSVGRLGRQTATSATQMTALERAALRGRMSFQSLSTVLNVGVVAGFAAVGFAINRFVRDTFEAGNLIEGLEIRFQLLFGSVEEGARAFDVLNEFAARVPFSLEDIAAASGNLAVVSNDADELANVLEITGNVAAATGLSFRQTAEQIQRSFAGGIASADVFRERGVRAMLGFEAGVTVSVERTIQRFNEVFGRGGTFGTATDLLAETLQGQVSLVQDAYFQFRRVVSEEFFDFLTSRIRNLVGDFQNNASELERIARRIGQGFVNAIIAIEESITFLVENFQTLRNVVLAFVGIRFVAIVNSWTAALTVFATTARGGTGAMVALNTAIRANPFGIIVTAITAGVTAIILFREQIAGLIGQLDELIRRGNSLNAQADAAEARARVEEDIANSVRRAVEAKNAEEMAIRETSAAQREFNNLVTEAEEAYGSLNDLLIIHETRAQGILDFRHAELGIIRDVEEREERRNRLLEQANERIRIRNEANRNYQQQINDALQTEADRLQSVNNLILEQTGLRRRAFDDAVRTAEVAQMTQEAIEAANRREQARVGGLTPEISQEQIEQIMMQEAAWESVHEVIDNISSSIVDDLFDSIRSGENVFDSLRNSALRALNDIARQVASSALSDIFSRGVQSATGGAGGSVLNTIFGGARRVLGFQNGGIVPGGAPYTDRVPALLTPGERVIPRNEVNQPTGGNTNVTNINISGNVDQRAIDQIRSVIASSSAEVGESNRTFTRNTRGLRPRRR